MLEVRFLAGESESMCAEKCKKQNKKNQKPPVSQVTRRKAREESAVVQAFNPSVQVAELG